MRIDAVHNRMLLILDMAQSGYFNPEQRDEALDIASLQVFKEYLRIYGDSMLSKEAMQPFKVTGPFETDDQGNFSIPGSERLLRCSVFVMVGEMTVRRSARIVAEDKLDDRLDSQLREVTDMYPIIRDKGQGVYQHFPVKSTGGELTYIKRPLVPKFNYTVGNDDEEIFDINGSVSFEWGDKFIDEVIFSAIAVLGIPLDNEWLVRNGFTMKQASK